MVQVVEAPNVEFISRVSKLPLVNFAFDYANSVYGKAKDGSPQIIQKTLLTAEETVKFAAGRAIPVINKLEKPIHLVDTLACKTLDKVEATVPAITKTPEEIATSTRTFVTEKLEPVREVVFKATDKILGNPIGQFTLGTVNYAIGTTDSYVDYYLPSKTAAEASEPATNEVPKEPMQQLTWSAYRAANVASKLQSRVVERAQVALREAGTLGLAYVGTLTTLVEWAQLNWKDARTVGLPAKLRELGSEFRQQLQKQPVNDVIPLVVGLTERVASLLRNAIAATERIPRFDTEEIRQKMENGLNVVTESGAQLAKSIHLDDAALSSLVVLQQRLPLVYSSLVEASAFAVDVSKKAFPNWNFDVKEIVNQVNVRSTAALSPNESVEEVDSDGVSDEPEN